jgi:hypothetical protein
MAIAQPQRVKDLSKGSQHICKQGHMRGGFVDKQAIRDLDARVDRDIEQGNTARRRVLQINRTRSQSYDEITSALSGAWDVLVTERLAVNEELAQQNRCSNFLREKNWQNRITV